MSVKFKTLKHRHKIEAAEISGRIAAKEDGWQYEQDNFIGDLIADWDYVDPDTGQPVTVGDLGELTNEQYNEVIAEFNREMNDRTEVKKTTKSNASSLLIGSKRQRAATPPIRRNG
jgi:hypothetical protein